MQAPPPTLLELPGKTHTARNRGDAVRVGSCLQPARSLGKGLGCSPSLSQRCRQCLHLLQALVVGLLIFFMGLHHDHTSGTLGACGCTQVRLRGDVDVGQVLVLAQNWKMAVHLNRQCISCQNHDPFLALVDKFLNLLHPATNLLLLHSLLDALVELARQAAGSQGLRDGVQIDQQLFVRALLAAALRRRQQLRARWRR